MNKQLIDKMRKITLVTGALCALCGGTKLAAAELIQRPAAESIQIPEEFDTSIKIEDRKIAWKLVPFSTVELVLPGVGVALRGYSPEFGGEISVSYIYPEFLKASASALFYNGLPDAGKWYTGIGVGGAVPASEQVSEIIPFIPLFFGREGNFVTFDLGVDIGGFNDDMVVAIPFGRFGFTF